MTPFDNGRFALSGGLAGDFDIEQFADVGLHADVDAAFAHEAFSIFEGFGREVFEHLQLVFRLADECSQGNGNGQSNHARAGDAHAHRVFQDVARKLGGDFLGSATEHFRGARRTQRHGHRLCATDGRHHLLLNEIDNSLFICIHSPLILGIPRTQERLLCSRRSPRAVFHLHRR